VSQGTDRESEEAQDGEQASAAGPFTTRKPRARRWLLAGLLGIGAFCIFPRRWMTVNDITTGQTPEYPDLPAHTYAADLETTRAAAEAAFRALPRWRIVPLPTEEDAAGQPLHAEVRTLLFGFVDDVTVRFQSLPTMASSGSASPRTRVIIRSHSRVGRGDLGENARHIAALQAAMDARLPHERQTSSTD
jgi:uncharacterized protein (DUF1499 family)